MDSHGPSESESDPGSSDYGDYYYGDKPIVLRPNKLVAELLDEALDHLRCGSWEQIEHNTNFFREHLTADTGKPDNPTALHILASSNSHDLPDIAKLRPLIEFLIQHPKNLLARINIIEEKKKGLVEAMCQAHPEINSILSIQNHQKKNCLHIAIEKEVEFLPFLIEHAEPHTLCTKDGNGNTPLHLAFEIIQKMAHNSDEASALTYNNSKFSPYLHHKRKRAEREARKARAEGETRDRHNEERVGRGSTPPNTPSAPSGRLREAPSELKPPPRSNTDSIDYSGKETNFQKLQAPTNQGPSKYRNIETSTTDDQMLEPKTHNPYYGLNTTPFSTGNSDARLDSGSPKEPSRPENKSKPSNKHGSEEGSSSKPSTDSIRKIRLFLKQHYLRERNHDAALDILYGRNTTSGKRTLLYQGTLELIDLDHQIYFDLSGYTTLTRRQLEKGFENVQFDDTLQYVEIPKIIIEGAEAIANTSKIRDPSLKTDPSGNGRTDIVFIFSWLRSKGVEKILQVIVDDLGPRAHGDEAIEASTKGFGVEVWNWKKVDLCAEVIVIAAPTVRVAHMYWTGNNAVLRSWCDVGGLRKLKDLRSLYVHVQQGLDSHARTKENMSYFEDQMKAARPNIEITWDGLQLLQETSTSTASAEPAKRATQPSQHDWIRCMTEFRKLLYDAENTFSRIENRKIEEEINEPIKVALIDDGVNINELEHTPIGGRSFCPRNEDKSRNFPYYVSSSGHGTVMASQIYRICPRVQLYVLKLEDYPDEHGNRQITARSAAQAIRAAVGRGVHIISMSWTLEAPSDERVRADLDSAIASAVRRGILLFCSASDGGAREDVSYPATAAPGRAFRIGGAYASGTTDPDVGSTSRIDFTLPGNNVEVASSLAGNRLGGTGAGGGEAFKYRTGSSVATALAAGLAALILYCVQVRLLLAPDDEKKHVRAQFERLKGPEQMMKAFRNIGVTEESNYKYIAIWETFEKPLRKSKEMPKDRWIGLVADIGAELCMKIST
ncbi:hypothetical protein F5Y10DRAFT_285770 [Nemania abortiva]|nr:hypothetical protein F5Y10DRAFT_285770 [Nemania abortiva]